MDLTEQDFKDFMEALTKASTETPRYVMYTGYEGYIDFNFVMRGMSLYLQVPYTKTGFKKVRWLWQVNVYVKHGLYKIIVNLKDSTFTARYGTEVLGTTKTIESCYTLYIKNHKDNTYGRK